MINQTILTRTIILLAILCISTACTCGNVAATKGPPPCTTNADCATTEYCAKSVGDCDGVGSCATRPQMCTMDWNPVCGCDGVTYGNLCGAAGAGANVIAIGECK